jgi:archaellum component FlaC
MYSPNKFTSTHTKVLHEKIDALIATISKRDAMNINNINVDIQFDDDRIHHNVSTKEMVENIGSLIDSKLTGLINAINSGGKQKALDASMDFATSIRNTLSNYIIYIKKQDKGLKRQLKRLHQNINDLDAHLYRAEVTSQESVKRTLSEIQQNKILQTKLDLYMQQSQQYNNRASNADDNENINAITNAIMHTNVATPEGNAHQYRFNDYIDIFQNNLAAMRDKFSNVEKIISMQKEKQTKQIQSLMYENEKMRREMNYHHYTNPSNGHLNNVSARLHSPSQQQYTNNSGDDTMAVKGDAAGIKNDDLERLLKRVEGKIIHAKKHDLLS